MSDPNTESLDPQAAAKAFSALRSRLAAIPNERVEPARADVIKAAVAAWSVARFIQQPNVRARFARLPKEEFQQAHVDDLAAIALATFHAATELQSAQATASGAKLPVDLLQSATEIKTRMLKLCEYHLGDHPVDGAEIADIRQGAGHIDLALDLSRLAKLYQKHKNIIKKDPKHYLASDANDARTHSSEILRLLGEARNENAKAWSDMVARAWVLLLDVYGEVSNAGRWLFRHDEPENRFPSLWAVARTGQGRPKKTAEESSVESATEGTDT
jgi:hypothetical protein